MRTCLALMLTAIVLVIAACGDAGEAGLSREAPNTLDQRMNGAYTDYDSVVTYAAVTEDTEGRGTKSIAADQTTANANAPDPAMKPDARKIIYNASINLVVDDLSGMPTKVSDLTKKHGGFIAGSSIHGSEGEPRYAQWTLRVPSAKYDAFVGSAQGLGQLRQITSETQEVTAEYVDLEARIRNLKAQEARLKEHLSTSTKDLKDILAVEREMSRVRGEVERLEGRLNVLKDLTSLSTVTLTVEEIKNFVPPPTEQPGYTTRLARTWGGSVDNVGGFFTSLSLGAVGLAPWLVVAVPLLLIITVVGRRVLRRLARLNAKPITATAQA